MKLIGHRVLVVLWCSALLLGTAACSRSDQPIGIKEAPTASSTATFWAKQSGERHTVSVKKASVHISPSIKAHVVSSLGQGTSVHVREMKAGWARITVYVDGSQAGFKEPVANWIQSKHLKKTQPIDQGAR